jgi:hypothetical protein
MKGMGQDMVKNERRGADCDVSVGEMEIFGAVKRLICQARQILVCLPADFLLEALRVDDRGTFGKDAIDVRQTLERSYPESFAIINMNYLLAQCGEAKCLQDFRIICRRECGQVI